MTLGEKQRKFARMVGHLLLVAYDMGYEVTLGTAYRKPGWLGKLGDRSLHCKRLAIDINLFANGKYLTKSSDHEPLGKFWESIGGSWGGRFGDGNHYSLEHGGVK